MFSANVDFGSIVQTTNQSYLDVQVKSSAANGKFTSLDSRSKVAPEDSACPGSWTLDGNAGNPPGSFLGTVDANDLNLYANGLQVANFAASGGGVSLSPGFAALGTKSTAVSDSFGTTAGAAYSFAGGFNGSTAFPGSFVWGDAGGPFAFDSGPNEFIMSATGGVGINTSQSPIGGPLAHELTIAPTFAGNDTDLVLVENTTAPYLGFDIFASNDGFFGIDGMLNNGGSIEYDKIMYVAYGGADGGNIMFNGAPFTLTALSVGTNTNNGNGAFLSEGGIWTNSSSRTFKDGFAPVDALGVLSKLVSMPVQTWFYKNDHREGQHMGPFAEDFAETFGLGNDDKHITTVDESGVALAAIQGLNKKVETENAELKQRSAALQRTSETLAQENAELRSTLERVLDRVAKLEQR